MLKAEVISATQKNTWNLTTSSVQLDDGQQFDLVSFESKITSKWDMENFSEA